VRCGKVARRFRKYFFASLSKKQPARQPPNPINQEGEYWQLPSAMNGEVGMDKRYFVAAVALLLAVLGAAPLRASSQSAAPSGLEAQVRRELVTLPFYSVYDDLNYEVSGDTVMLTGKVTRPTLRSDAEAAVRRVEGVANVVNQVEVLPLSPFDNRLRRAAYLTLFSYNSPLFRYGLGGDPSIHIIVENGHLTLKGTVASEADKQIATMYARGISGLFSVTNELTVS
jgi:hyperosmotically inducible protein